MLEFGVRFEWKGAKIERVRLWLSSVFLSVDDNLSLLIVSSRAVDSLEPILNEISRSIILVSLTVLGPSLKVGWYCLLTCFEY